MEIRERLDILENFPLIEITTQEQGAWIRILITRDIELKWNRWALIYAHGFRAEGVGLRSQINELTQDDCYLRLLKEGWCVAMTSYRTEGRCVRDGIKDVFNVRNIICQEIAIPFRTIIEGQSMGGAIATYIAERENSQSLFHGVLACGAALLVKDETESAVQENFTKQALLQKTNITKDNNNNNNNNNPQNNNDSEISFLLPVWHGPLHQLAFSHAPNIPIIYCTNVSELGPITDYVQKCKKNQQCPYVPAVFEISREGHNWINSDERYSSIMHLTSWIAYDSLITLRHTDNTKIVTSESTAEWIFCANHTNDELYLQSAISKVTPLRHGTIGTGLLSSDLSRLGIRVGQTFSLIFPGNRKVTVHFGAYPFLVAKDSWIAFEMPDGRIGINRNTFEARNPFEEANLKTGDSVTVEISPTLYLFNQKKIERNAKKN